MVHYMVDHLQFMVQHIFYGTAYGTVSGTSYGTVHGTVGLYGAAYGTVYGTCTVYGTKFSLFTQRTGIAQCFCYLVNNCICTICKYTRGLLLYEPTTKINI